MNKTGSLRLLIADGDPDFVAFISKRLEALKDPLVSVEACATGAELLQRIYAKPFDLVFLEMGLPDMGGLDLLGRLAQTSLPLPIVVLSTENDSRPAVEAMKRGVLDHVMKQDLATLDLKGFLERAIATFGLKRENAELQQINQMKNDFLGTISHELRTPLTSILGLAELLHSGRLGALNDKQGDSVTKILEQSQNLSHVINQLLDVQDTLKAKAQAALRPVLLNEVVERQMRAARSLFNRKEVALRGAPPVERFVVLGNGENLGKVIEHLLLNALKFTPAGGTVTVSLRAGPDQGVSLCVEDTGQGIPREALPYVFQKFFHADPTLTRAYGGLGLGLSYCQHMVEAHGGRIWVESPGVNQGTTVNVTLPRIEDGAVPPGAKAAALKTVLWVDDNPSLLELIEVGFSSLLEGVRLVTRRSGKAGLEEVRVSPPNLIVLDIMMPDMNGIEVLAILKADPATRDIPVLVVTGYREAAQEAVAGGALDYFLKPFHLSDMLDKIRQTLGLPKAGEKL
jgi:signal transduction histidine kinase